jgi:hypothetical protein
VPIPRRKPGTTACTTTYPRRFLVASTAPSRRKASFIGRLLICRPAAIMKDNRRFAILLTRSVAEFLKDLPKAGLMFHTGKGTAATTDLLPNTS